MPSRLLQFLQRVPVDGALWQSALFSFRLWLVGEADREPRWKAACLRWSSPNARFCFIFEFLYHFFFWNETWIMLCD